MRSKQLLTADDRLPQIPSEVSRLHQALTAMHFEGFDRPPTYDAGQLVVHFTSESLSQEFMSWPLRQRRCNHASGRSRDPQMPTRYLYKYRTLDPSDAISVNKLRSLIVDNRIWLAAASSLNDPHDLDFRFVENRDKADRKRWAKENAGVLPPMSPARRLLRTREIERARMTSASIAAFKADQRRTMGVFCASRDPRSDVMWAHYAAEGRGVCVQYTTYEDPLFLMMQPVVYSNTFPQATLPTPTGRVQDHYLMKSLSWSYECEWRLTMPLQNCHIQLRPQTVSAVIFGVNTSRAVRDCVAELLQERIRRHFPPVELFHGQLTPGRYGVSILRSA